jgi:hypothetical protein
MDGHSRGQATEVLLPRATINPPCAQEFIAVMDGRRIRQFDYGFYFEPEQRRKAPGAATTWLLTAFYLHSEKIFQGWWLLCGSQQSWLACAQHSQPLSSWFSSNSALHLIGICLGTMVRRRGKPRRGSAWDAHKAQRRREEELERALALASSILRKKARVERRACSTPLLNKELAAAGLRRRPSPRICFQVVLWRRTCQLGTCRVTRSQAPWRRSAGRTTRAPRLRTTTFLAAWWKKSHGWVTCKPQMPRRW